MSDLKGIPVAIAEVEPSSSANGNALPILFEIEALLNDLVASGKTASIDLRSLPLLPGDYAMLKEILGQGEVSATLEAMGPTQVRETAVHGVWWVTHHNSDETVIAEFIEVTFVPGILQTPPADARAGLESLRSRLARVKETDKGGVDV